MFTSSANSHCLFLIHSFFCTLSIVHCLFKLTVMLLDMLCAFTFLIYEFHLCSINHFLLPFIKLFTAIAPSLVAAMPQVNCVQFLIMIITCMMLHTSNRHKAIYVQIVFIKKQYIVLVPKVITHIKPNYNNLMLILLPHQHCLMFWLLVWHLARGIMPFFFTTWLQISLTFTIDSSVFFSFLLYLYS